MTTPRRPLGEPDLFPRPMGELFGMDILSSPHMPTGEVLALPGGHLAAHPLTIQDLERAVGRIRNIGTGEPARRELEGPTRREHEGPARPGPRRGEAFTKTIRLDELELEGDRQAGAWARMERAGMDPSMPYTVTENPRDRTIEIRQRVIVPRFVKQEFDRLEGRLAALEREHQAAIARLEAELESAQGWSPAGDLSPVIARKEPS